MNKTPDNVIDIAIRIGHFYMDKNNNVPSDALREIQDLHIVEIKESPEEIIISLGRPGLLIGRKGENIQKLTNYLGKHVKCVESYNDLLTWLTMPMYDNSY